ncbi:DUF294 nucleotidyltransferase-like domain-containing protein [Caldimonas sp. KR1-144]|uniref:DUF294 nucleotidyltransferase-like domain-containing protein n=1 Tax=Caldimonas sp. KR1-144 TaxID=3400911 RepID=UPI003C0FE7DD
MASSTLIAQLRDELRRHPPFAQMNPDAVDALVGAAEQLYFAPGERVLGPEDGPIGYLLVIRKGAISGRRAQVEAAAGFEYEAGDLFPVGAMLGERPVSARYEARSDSFCLRVPAEAVRQVAAHEPAFADFLNRRVMKLLDYSRQALQVAYSAQTLAEQSLERPLRECLRRPPVTVARATPVGEALALMQAQRIGSLVVQDADGSVAGIFTRHDVLGRVALPQVPLATPIEAVMTTPVHTLACDASAQDAALMMSRHGIRHVPVTERGRVVGLVSERDLFAMQRLSLKQVGNAIHGARDVATLAFVADDIRRFARSLLGQGVGARQLTELVSRLNDALTERLVALLAAECGVDMGRACWLAFGSEGRSEQTIATDQDNGLVFESDDAQRDRPAWLAFARRVNDALDRCGYPLCKGNVMAGNPECCLTPAEWAVRFTDWMEHGAPKDLLAASIYFDLRPIAGRAALADGLRELLARHAPRLPRFMKQMAGNALERRVPLNWYGGFDAERIDLKLYGTAVFVDAARVYALAHGIVHANTRRRFEALGPVLGVPAQELEGWIGGFEYLQMLRLRAQIDAAAGSAPNEVAVDALNDIDRRVLKESLRVAHRLQQRLELDYER